MYGFFVASIARYKNDTQFNKDLRVQHKNIKKHSRKDDISLRNVFKKIGSEQKIAFQLFFRLQRPKTIIIQGVT